MDTQSTESHQPRLSGIFRLPCITFLGSDNSRWPGDEGDEGDEREKNIAAEMPLQLWI